jgi:hypothetical protein
MYSMHTTYTSVFVLIIRTLRSASQWCNVVQRWAEERHIDSMQRNTPRRTTVRVSVSFPREQYDLLERLARDKKVSVAWITRDAVDRYLTEQWPLLQADGARLR